jgi:hypothetical protein
MLGRCADETAELLLGLGSSTEEMIANSFQSSEEAHVEEMEMSWNEKCIYDEQIHSHHMSINNCLEMQ